MRLDGQVDLLNNWTGYNRFKFLFLCCLVPGVRSTVLLLDEIEA